MPDSTNVDVVVIGSGFGGSISANRLALSGKRVLLLERGPWRDSVPVRSMGVTQRAPFPVGKHGLTHFLHSVQGQKIGLQLNKAGMYELSSFPGLHVLVASAVGGGSTAYGGLLEPPRRPHYWQGHHPELDPAAVEQYYPKVIADMGGVQFTAEHALPQSVWTHLTDKAQGCAYPSPAQPHMGLLLPSSPEHSGEKVTDANGVERRTCAFNGDSFLGSPSGAKASVDFIYLAPVHNKGVTVRDLCAVTRIQPARPVDGGGYIVHFTDLKSKLKHSVRAGKVVLAAGSLNTQRLLFASSQSTEGLQTMPFLGKNFGANGDLMALWSRPAWPVPSFESTPSHGAFTIAGHESVTFGMGGLPGVNTLPLPNFVKQMLSKRFFMYGIAGDSNAGIATYQKGRLHVRYHAEKEPVYAQMREGFRALAQASGDKIWVMKKPLSVHPWGGACVGANPQQGVVDHRGEVFGNPGLFIADGACLPASPSGPPSLAIAAWAHHVAHGIAG